MEQVLYTQELNDYGHLTFCMGKVYPYRIAGSSTKLTISDWPTVVFEADNESIYQGRHIWADYITINLKIQNALTLDFPVEDDQ
jgi:hypothetical protein